MRTVYLMNVITGKMLQFPSLKEASKVLGLPYGTLYASYKSGKECGGYAKASPFDYEVDFESDLERQELDFPHEAIIEGRTFVAVKCNDKTNCTACHIYMLDPPKSMMQQPLCYLYKCGTRKIVDVCSKYKCIWKVKSIKK